MSDYEWSPWPEEPLPMGPSLVYLEKEMQGSRIHGAYRHPKVMFVGSHFWYDAPKILCWISQDALPKPPKGKNDE